MRFQDERALGAIGDHEAVDDMVELAAVTAALVDVAHQLSRLTAVWGILGREESHVSTFFIARLSFCVSPRPTL